MTRMHGPQHEELAVSSRTPSSVSQPTSDADLENRVRVFLRGLKIPGLRGVTVDIEGGVARVGGEVQTFHEKQLATHCCQRVAGVMHVVNNLCVAPSPPVHRPPAG